MNTARRRRRLRGALLSLGVLLVCFLLAEVGARSIYSAPWYEQLAEEQAEHRELSYERNHHNLRGPAHEQISTDRAGLGALQNRLNNTINNLGSISENITAARSRVLDADFASESANLARHQIIQQAGTTILSQANQSTQAAVSLLG